MTRTLSWLSGLIVIALLAVGVIPAHAQGPYYALPSWDQTLPSATRFIVLSNMGSAAVLDRETGLVWERSPTPVKISWVQGMDRCMKLTVSNRRGWRLPTFQELSSLQDASQSLALPVAHPFVDVQPDFYWSATTTRFAAGELARFVAFFDFGQPFTWGDKQSDEAYVWCVRGGQGVDPQ